MASKRKGARAGKKKPSKGMDAPTPAKRSGELSMADVESWNRAHPADYSWYAPPARKAAKPKKAKKVSKLKALMRRVVKRSAPKRRAAKKTVRRAKKKARRGKK